ncbi:MAG: uroporphyrinogen decarboxylase family protein [Candidatus Marinimicrobia bacterium]|nr:uroporphyrinogen decarboxylase family protein [Candidatus Neomarinimicrobiota bacterium]
MMTSRERLETVIRGGVPDRVPATVHQWQPYHYGNIMGVTDELEAFQAVGLDAVIYPWACVRREENPDWRGTGVETPLPDGLVAIEASLTTPDGVLTGKAMRSPYTTTETEHLFKRPEDMHLIRKYKAVPELEVDAVLALRQRLGDDGILRCFTNGPQGSPWQDACCYYGTAEMIYQAYDDPDWTHEFLNILLDKKLEFYRKNLTPLKGVFSMIETGGGAASNTVISPAMFEEFCLPYDRRQHDLIHEIDPDIAISYHTCGGMMKLLELIPRNGCDFSETLSPPGCGGDIHDHCDEAEVKRVLGAKVKLMGGLNQSEILEQGTGEQIAAEVERCFRHYGVGGGYIMMPSDHFFHAPKENLAHYAAAVRERGRY